MAVQSHAGRSRPRRIWGLGLTALAGAVLAGMALWGRSDGADKPPAASQPGKKWTPPRFTARKSDRDAMIRAIRRYPFTDETVLKAMGNVPRHEFVPESLSRVAYENRPQPIGHGQTISQPYIVAEMTRHLALKPNAKVLEIGTGSGYQAAVLAEITPHVFSIEIVKALADPVAKRLERLGYTTVRCKHADGYFGWAEHAPFDAIVVTAASSTIPPPLLKQLAPGGRMVIPVGGPFATQSLMLIEKKPDGKLRSRNLMAVRFVPFVRKVR